MINQKELTLESKSRGFHLITKEILNQIELPEIGLLNLFIKHTSCGLTINENADPSVRIDFANSFDQLIKENLPHYTHTAEGSDDMPAHIKSTLTGHQITIPITGHQLNLGVWQGIYLCEFRNTGGKRKVICTIYS
jgi:secondary thiamine-phosphate synthase enzyme